VRRYTPCFFVAAVIITCAVWIVTVQAADLPRIDLNVDAAGPRQVEDTTEKAVARDYARAWSSMATALSDNRTDVLDADLWALRSITCGNE
jgi:hypothetical protein